MDSEQTFYCRATPRGSCADVRRLSQADQPFGPEPPPAEAERGLPFCNPAYRWRVSTIGYSFHSALLTEGTESFQRRVRSMIELSFKRIESCSSLTFYEQEADAEGGIRISLGLADVPADTLAKLSVTVRGRNIVRATIDLNETATLAALDHSVEDLLNVLMHLIGHAIGLGHATDPQAIMYAFHDRPAWAPTQTNNDQIASQYGARNAHVPARVPLILQLGPSSAYFDNCVLVAWAGNDADHHLNVMHLGITEGSSRFEWLRKLTLRDTSAVGACLVRFRGKLVMCWPDSSGTIHTMTTSNGLVWVDKQPLSAICVGRPCLIEHGDELILAFTDRHQRVIIMRSHDARAWTVRAVITDYQVGWLSLASFHGQLLLAWNDVEHPQFLHLMKSENAGAHWQTPVPLLGYSFGGPSLLAHNGELLIAWNDKSGEHKLRFMRSNDAVHFSRPQKLNASSLYAPSLVAAGSRSAIVWTDREPCPNLHIQLIDTLA